MAKKKSSSRGKVARRRYAKEFREEAVQMLLDGHSAVSVAERLG
ncbi:MAG: transposase, partial [Planctomycetaceae bacterium]